MGDFQKLIAWQVAMELAAEVYKVSRKFPVTERYGLTQQLRRAAVSVSSNIAEGAGRGGSKEFGGFLRIARGSLYEPRSQLYLALKLEFVAEPDTAVSLQLAERVSKLLNAMLGPLPQP